MPTNISQNQPSSNLILRIFQLFVFIILLLMVVVQFNDPDPLFWIAFYGACALVPVFSFLKLNNKPLFYACLVFGVIALFISYEGALEYTNHYKDESLLQSMSADKPYLEETREFFGVVIALALITAHQFILSRQPAQ
ncbi:MAG: transmembrane 220 family protein [Gammaproteobacteria bacterium]